MRRKNPTVIEDELSRKIGVSQEINDFNAERVNDEEFYVTFHIRNGYQSSFILKYKSTRQFNDSGFYPTSVNLLVPVEKGSEEKMMERIRNLDSVYTPKSMNISEWKDRENVADYNINIIYSEFPVSGIDPIANLISDLVNLAE